MESTFEQRQAQFDGELTRKWDAHHRVVNAQPLSQQDRIAAENRARIATWSGARRSELGLTAEAGEPAAAAPAADTPAPEASADASASTVVVKPGAKPAA